jgi:hypothetical protein
MNLAGRQNEVAHGHFDQAGADGLHMQDGCAR